MKTSIWGRGGGKVKSYHTPFYCHREPVQDFDSPYPPWCNLEGSSEIKLNWVCYKSNPITIHNRFRILLKLNYIYAYPPVPYGNVTILNTIRSIHSHFSKQKCWLQILKQLNLSTNLPVFTDYSALHLIPQSVFFSHLESELFCISKPLPFLQLFKRVNYLLGISQLHEWKAKLYYFPLV